VSPMSQDITLEENGSDALGQSEMNCLLVELGSMLDRELEDAHRLFHGRGHQYPRLDFINIDYYAPVVLITCYRAVDQRWLQSLCDAIEALFSTRSDVCIAVQHRYRREGRADESVEMAVGECPAFPVAKESGFQYGLNLSGRQNIGFFLDMAPGRAWMAERARGKRVLNLFAYTCSFSVVALGNGAEQVINLDMSRAALSQGQRNHALNKLGLGVGAIYLGHNLFKSWKRLQRCGPFDVIVVDPPSRQPGSFIAEKDYARVLQKLATLSAPNAELLLCLNAPGLDVEWLQNLVSEFLPDAEFVARLANRADFPEANPDRNLKLLHYTLPGQNQEQSR
jgi:23S rRNA (cytosine1962-C5)-methyltransferase